jgi:hypothetical protein
LVTPDFGLPVKQIKSHPNFFAIASEFSVAERPSDSECKMHNAGTAGSVFELHAFSGFTEVKK